MWCRKPCETWAKCLLFEQMAVAACMYVLQPSKSSLSSVIASFVRFVCFGKLEMIWYTCVVCEDILNRCVRAPISTLFRSITRASTHVHCTHTHTHTISISNCAFPMSKRFVPFETKRIIHNNIKQQIMLRFTSEIFSFSHLMMRL